MSDEEILAELDEWLTNSLFTSSYRKIALQELIRRYNKLQDLIKKQQKKIEELKDLYSDEKIRNTIIKRYRKVIEKDYVSKDKIRKTIEDLEKHKIISSDEFTIKVLKDLIGE